MDPAQYVESIRRDSDGLLDAASSTDRSTPIAACPGWTVPDLVWHVAEVQDFWGTVVAERMQDPSGYEDPVRPGTHDELVAFAAASADRLATALTEVDPATPLWTWADQRDAAFVLRRMAQEAAVHRVDAERAAGHDHRIERELASDGIDEFLEHFLAGDVVAGSVHLHCTDVAGEWLVAPGADGAKVVTREHAKGDAAIRGPAHDLLMVLWRREPLDSVDVVGDRDVAERFVTASRLE